MSEPEIVEAKKGRVKKNGDPDRRSTSSALNVSKARSKVKAFLKAGKQIIDNSDSESSDEIIDLVIRKNDMHTGQDPSLKFVPNWNNHIIHIIEDVRRATGATIPP